TPPAVPGAGVRKPRPVPRWVACEPRSTGDGPGAPPDISACRFQRPVMSVHGDTGAPPPHAPAVHVSPVVQSLPSSHALPSPAGEQIDGSPAQVQHASTWQVASQPSPFVVLPSSHVQRVATTPPTP